MNNKLPEVLSNFDRPIVDSMLCNKNSYRRLLDDDQLINLSVFEIEQLYKD